MHNEKLGIRTNYLILHLWTIQISKQNEIRIHPEIRQNQELKDGPRDDAGKQKIPGKLMKN